MRERKGEVGERRSEGELEGWRGVVQEGRRREVPNSLQVPNKNKAPATKKALATKPNDKKGLKETARNQKNACGAR